MSGYSRQRYGNDRLTLETVVDAACHEDTKSFTKYHLSRRAIMTELLLKVELGGVEGQRFDIRLLSFQCQAQPLGRAGAVNGLKGGWP